MPFEHTEHLERAIKAEQVIRWLEEENGRRFDMTHYAQVDGQSVDYSEAARTPACRTACCIAGEIAIRIAPMKKASAHGIATEFLGTSNEDLVLMFFPNHRPLPKITKPEAIAMLRHWGETGEVKWL